MSVTGALPIRTQVRDAVLAALRLIETDPAAPIKGAELVTDYLHETEIKKPVSYGVIVTNEDVTVHSQRSADVSLTVLIVIYVRSAADRRAVLDAAIEAVWMALRSGQAVKPVIPYLALEGVETDEGATAAKPYAQAVMRWTARVRRDVSW